MHPRDRSEFIRFLRTLGVWVAISLIAWVTFGHLLLVCMGFTLLGLILSLRYQLGFTERIQARSRKLSLPYSLLRGLCALESQDMKGFLLSLEDRKHMDGSPEAQVFDSLVKDILYLNPSLCQAILLELEGSKG